MKGQGIGRVYRSLIENLDREIFLGRPKNEFERQN
jgi:hypothetical protein